MLRATASSCASAVIVHAQHGGYACPALEQSGRATLIRAPLIVLWTTGHHGAHAARLVEAVAAPVRALFAHKHGTAVLRAALNATQSCSWVKCPVDCLLSIGAHGDNVRKHAQAGDRAARAGPALTGVGWRCATTCNTIVTAQSCHAERL